MNGKAQKILQNKQVVANDTIIRNKTIGYKL